MIPAYLWGRRFKIGRGERGSHMVLSDMKKLGHQCCLFIVINTATCFASAAGKLLAPRPVFHLHGTRINGTLSPRRETCFYTEISLESRNHCEGLQLQRNDGYVGLSGPDLVWASAPLPT